MKVNSAVVHGAGPAACTRYAAGIPGSAHTLSDGAVSRHEFAGSSVAKSVTSPTLDPDGVIGSLLGTNDRVTS